MGVPNTPLYEYWGRSARAGANSTGRSVARRQAAFGEEGSGAEIYLREAYAAKNGSEDGFDEFLWATRNDSLRRWTTSSYWPIRQHFPPVDVGDKVVLCLSGSPHEVDAAWSCHACNRCRRSTETRVSRSSRWNTDVIPNARPSSSKRSG